MIKIGEYNRLQAVRRTDFGLYLSDGQDDVLLPRRYVPEGLELGESLRVFVTTDSEDRPVATTQRPLGKVGDFVALTVKAVNQTGAFMDWGLDKDLLVPYSEQHRRMEEGKRYVVRIERDDKTNRVYATSRIAKFLKSEANELRMGLEVDLLVVEPGEMGVRVIVDDTFFGMVFPDEIHQRLRIGDKMKGYVKKVREDGGLAISLSPQGYYAAVDQGPMIVEKLRKAGGFLPFSDKSAPDDIRQEFGLSKATFKKAIGNLMKSKTIDITDHGIRLRS